MGRSHFSPADGPLMLRRIFETPLDDGPRLAYSDWLEERGEPGDAERAKFIRVQIEMHNLRSKANPKFGLRVGFGLRVEQGRLEYSDTPETLRYRELREIQIKLFDKSFHQWDEHKFSWSSIINSRIEWNLPHHDQAQLYSIAFVFHRGFVAKVCLTCEQFLTHAEKLFESFPITKVNLTDKEPIDNAGIETYFNRPSNRADTWFWFSGDSLRWEIPDCLGMRQKEFDHESKAYGALSTICVMYGRQVAELPPLKVQTTDMRVV